MIVEINKVTYVCSDTKNYVSMLLGDSGAPQVKVVDRAAELIKNLSVRDLVIDQVIATAHSFSKLERQLAQKLFVRVRNITIPPGPAVPAAADIIKPDVLREFMNELVDFCNKLQTLCEVPLPRLLGIDDSISAVPKPDPADHNQTSAAAFKEYAYKYILPYEKFLCAAAAKLSEVMMYVGQLILSMK